jgi:hypothetical protein
MRFSPHQLRAIENMKSREAAEHRQWMCDQSAIDASTGRAITVIGSIF